MFHCSIPVCPLPFQPHCVHPINFPGTNGLACLEMATGRCTEKNMMRDFYRDTCGEFDFSHNCKNSAGVGLSNLYGNASIQVIGGLEVRLSKGHKKVCSVM